MFLETVKIRLRLRRGLTLARSKAEIEFINALAKRLETHISVQEYINGWFIDGHIKAHRAWVQFDGVYWHSSPKIQDRDREQDAWFVENNMLLLRITDKEWSDNPEGVLTRIQEQLGADQSAPPALRK